MKGSQCIMLLIPLTLSPTCVAIAELKGGGIFELTNVGMHLANLGVWRKGLCVVVVHILELV